MCATNTKAVRDEMAAKAAEPERIKELRSALSPVENVFLLLMVVSQIASYAMLAVSHADVNIFRQRLTYLSTFHAIWATRNYAAGNKRERGMVTYGVVALGTSFHRPMLAVLGAFMVWSSFLFVLSVMHAWPAAKLAHVNRKTIRWAVVFKAYVCSNLLLWLIIGWLLVQRLP